eukprot:Partr_v1_DN26417_c0_g2_i3_m23673 putative Transcription factor
MQAPCEPSPPLQTATIESPVNAADNPDQASICPTIQALLSIQNASSPTHDSGVGPEAEILAYAKLTGFGWSYFIRKLSVVIGRFREANHTHSHAHDIDLHLEGNNTISRKHARIEYSFVDRAWEVVALGRNGLLLNGQLITQSTAPQILQSGDNIVISNIAFVFQLPDSPPLFDQLVDTIVNTSPQHLSRSRSSLLSERGDVIIKSHAERETDENAHPTRTNSVSGHGIKNEHIADRGFRRRSRAIQLPDHSDGVDYSSDNANLKVKPPFSYASLISEAILSSENRKLTLSKIYQFIMEKYAYYRHVHGGWQNSVRHNLSLNNAFQKVPRGESDFGKGMYWTVDTHFICDKLDHDTTAAAAHPDEEHHEDPSGHTSEAHSECNAPSLLPSPPELEVSAVSSHLKTLSEFRLPGLQLPQLPVGWSIGVNNVDAQ